MRCINLFLSFGARTEMWCETCLTFPFPWKANKQTQPERAVPCLQVQVFGSRQKVWGPAGQGGRWEQASPCGGLTAAWAVGLLGSCSRAVLASNALISTKQANLQACSQKNGRAKSCREMRFVFGDAARSSQPSPLLFLLLASERFEVVSYLLGHTLSFRNFLHPSKRIW